MVFACVFLLSTREKKVCGIWMVISWMSEERWESEKSRWFFSEGNGCSL